MNFLFTRKISIFFACAGMMAQTPTPLYAGEAANRSPNVIIMFCDDMGYGDIGPFGAQGYSTPNLDQMAAEGMKFTDFYAGRSFCTPSRAALMTGCIPTRVGIGGNFNPKSKTGLNPAEMTIAEVLKQQDYATAIFGKWHLGHMPKYLPPNQGFDEYYGLPYSNDMWTFHPENDRYKFPDLPLYENLTVVKPAITPADQKQLTRQLTGRAVDFIIRNKDNPFFLYIPQPQPHVPLFASSEEISEGDRGLYADVIREIDWSVGEILKTLRRLEIAENTLFVFTSDNGPWLLYGNHGGSAGPLREGKGTSFEGGVRIPCVMWWPGTIPAGRECRELASTMDLLPTAAALSGAPLPKRKIDGKDISALMRGKPGAESPHKAFYHYDGKHNLRAVRSGKWKLVFPHGYNSPEPGSDGIPGTRVTKQIELSLFDLDADVGETTNLAEKYPEVVAKLETYADAMRADLGDGKKNRGSGRRGKQ